METNTKECKDKKGLQRQNSLRSQIQLKRYNLISLYYLHSVFHTYRKMPSRLR